MVCDRLDLDGRCSIHHTAAMDPVNTPAGPTHQNATAQHRCPLSVEPEQREQSHGAIQFIKLPSLAQAVPPGSKRFPVRPGRGYHRLWTSGFLSNALSPDESVSEGKSEPLMTLVLGAAQ